MASRVGELLNQKWRIGARHALYHKDGVWYNQLTRFPGALCDPRGYVVFRTEEEFRSCSRLRIGKEVNVSGHVSQISGYVLLPRDQWHTDSPEAPRSVPVLHRRPVGDNPTTPIRTAPREDRQVVSTDLSERILAAVKAKPGQKAKELATGLGVEPREVNSVLWGKLRPHVQQDGNYRWFPRGVAGPGNPSQGQGKQLDTPLARLARYYLDCLGHDDLGGVSVFAASRYGDPDYAEIPSLPVADDGGPGPFESEAGRRLLGGIQRDRNRQSLFLGYPVRLRLMRSRRGWEGYMVEPLLLFSFEETESRRGVPLLSSDPPQFNFKALGVLGGGSDASLLEEAIQLAEELGLGNTEGDRPDLDDLLLRLRAIRPDWDWGEELNPNALSQGGSLSKLSSQGIYNRAILVASERSPYTKGLETELRAFQSVEETKYHETALGAWLGGATFDTPAPDQQPLLEVLELNSEQRQAVRQALGNPLTVITGPPGTGKSQVVTSVLVNAAHRGMKVLFASKNNKAVDVVETRVNSLGPRPVLLRLGANQYQTRLSEYLISLLGAKASPDDQARHLAFQGIQAQLRHRSDELTHALDATIALRNEVDRIEQSVEKARLELGETVFQQLRDIDANTLAQEVSHLCRGVDNATRGKQNFLVWLLWPFVRESRFKQLREVATGFARAANLVGLAPPGPAVPSQQTIDEWGAYVDLLEARLPSCLAVHQYFEKLGALTAAKSPETLTHDWRQVTQALTDNSEELWRSWLQLQPARLEPHHRKLLGDYSAILQMVAAANEQRRNPGNQVFRRYYELFPHLASILSCWAVTSLSVRGRVPFTENFFDLLVIDEASQCDIASALPLLFRARRVVVIGYPMQLRHISTLSKHQDQLLLSKHGLLGDYAGWAYSVRSLFDLASSLCRSEDIVALRDHHRSHPDIIEFSNTEFYEGRLRE